MTFLSMAVRGALSLSWKCPVPDTIHHLDKKLVMAYSYLAQKPDALITCVRNGFEWGVPIQN